jgi:hypothetical protein
MLIIDALFCELNAVCCLKPLLMPLLMLRRISALAVR